MSWEAEEGRYSVMCWHVSSCASVAVINNLVGKQLRREKCLFGVKTPGNQSINSGKCRQSGTPVHKRPDKVSAWGRLLLLSSDSFSGHVFPPDQDINLTETVPQMGPQANLI